MNKGVYNPQDWTLEDFKEFCKEIKKHNQNARPQIQIPYQLEEEFKKAALEYLKDR